LQFKAILSVKVSFISFIFKLEGQSSGSGSATGNEPLGAQHRGTPPREPKQRQSGCPTAIESGVRTELAIDSHQRNTPLEQARRKLSEPAVEATSTTVRTSRRESTPAT
jgi:hypothetical protein